MPRGDVIDGFMFLRGFADRETRGEIRVARTRKSLKLKRKIKSLPGHVRSSEAQLFQMKTVIQNLLGAIASRFHFFETAPTAKRAKRKKGSQYAKKRSYR